MKKHFKTWEAEHTIIALTLTLAFLFSTFKVFFGVIAIINGVDVSILSGDNFIFWLVAIETLTISSMSLMNKSKKEQNG